MAYDIDLTDNGASLAWDGINRQVVLKKTVDFSVAANNLAQNKVAALFNIPAGVLIEEVLMVVKTGDAQVSDVHIGIATASTQATISADGFLNSLSMVTAGCIRDLAGETYSKQDGTAGYYTLVDCDIILTNVDADTINGAIVDFFAICIDLN
jgi:hypothetical protein